MYEAATRYFPISDYAILAAAVSDFRPAKPSGQKVKKQEGLPEIILEETDDILLKLGRDKKEHQCLVGFALETQNSEANARKKLEKKNCDLIVLNSLADKGAGFEHDTNKVTLITGNKSRDLELMSKLDTAKAIFAYILEEIS
jgi:phosphopantothenoylcysteine decarboxylase/phosphopantothenate--cysteine ligase